MTEFAIILPILVVLLFGIAQFGIAFNNYVTITDAARAGVAVPGQLSVLGFDDIEMAAYMGLTTVRQPLEYSGARGAQLVPDLQTALSSAFKEHKLAHNSFACVISGSSRTADIEKILVQGAHGPRRLVVILQAGTLARLGRSS